MKRDRRAPEAGARGPRAGDAVTRRRLLRGLLAVSASGTVGPLVVGCDLGTRDTQVTPRALPPGKLAIWGATTDGGHWEGDFPAGFLREFQASNPGITIEPVRLVAPPSPDEKFLTATAGGEGPDLYSTGRTGFADWALNGVARALDDRMKTSRVIKRERFLPLMVEEGSWQDKAYGLYHSIDARVFYWNKDMYAGSGLNPEQPPDTWDDLVNVISKTLRRDSGSIDLLGFHPTIQSVGAHYWQAWLWALGGKYLSDDASKVAFNSEIGIRAMEWMLRLVNLQGGWNAIQQYVTAKAPSGLGALFSGRNVASYVEIGGLGTMMQNQKSDVRFGVGHLPKSPAGKRASVRGGFGLMLPSQAKNPDAAWRFAEFHLGTDVLARWNDSYDRLPTTKDASSSPTFLKNSPARKVQVDVAAYSQRIPAIHPAVTEITPLNVQMVNKVLTGQSSPRDALDEGARLIQVELDRFKGR